MTPTSTPNQWPSGSYRPNAVTNDGAARRFVYVNDGVRANIRQRH